MAAASTTSTQMDLVAVPTGTNDYSRQGELATPGVDRLFSVFSLLSRDFYRNRYMDISFFLFVEWLSSTESAMLIGSGSGTALAHIDGREQYWEGRKYTVVTALLICVIAGGNQS